MLTTRRYLFTLRRDERWLDARLHAQGIGQHGEVFYAACDKADGFFACRVR